MRRFLNFAILLLMNPRNSLIADFQSLPTAEDRLNWLLERAPEKRHLDTDERRSCDLVRGCLSRLWLRSFILNGRFHFRCKAESAVLEGVVSFLCDIWSDSSVEELQAADPAFLGISSLLSPNRRHAVMRSLDFMKGFAAAHSESEDVLRCA